MPCRDPEILAAQERIKELRARGAAVSQKAEYSDSGSVYRREKSQAQSYFSDAARLQAHVDRAMESYGRQIRTISTAVSRLGIDDDTLDRMIRRHTKGRTDSRTETTAIERGAILKELRAAGFRPTNSSRARPGQPTDEQMDRQTMLSRVEQLLAEQSLPWAYSEAILRRQRGITDRDVACPITSATDPELRAAIAALYRRANPRAPRRNSPPKRSRSRRG